jgi:pimeloyl-ACP methyl ester carboxylesterase
VDVVQEQTDERRALARLAYEEFGGAPRGIGEVHRAVAGRVFRAVGPSARPVQVLHDAIAARSYAAVQGGSALLARAAESALARGERGGGRELSTSPRGSAMIAAAQGLRGDALERDGSVLHAPMALRVDGRPVPARPRELAEAYPQASGRLVVFVHGLMETEFAWGSGGVQDGDTYGSRLSRDLGCTPLYIRYNAGRHISENGHSLAELLEDVVAAWPVDVSEIAVVGHSMGGLVARSACHQASLKGLGWVRRVRHVVSLGSPHMGAPLEEAVHLASAALGAVPETRPFAGFLRRRSAGIRDLRRGSLVDEDWHGRDPEALRAVACAEVPLLEGVTHCFVAATLTRSPRHPIGRLIGDLLVLAPSASGRSRSRRIPFEAEHGMHLGGATHFALLNHPEVYERLKAWLSAPRERAAPRPHVHV